MCPVQIVCKLHNENHWQAESFPDSDESAGQSGFQARTARCKDCEYDSVTDDEMLQLANQMKLMLTNDGNVLFYNINIVPRHSESEIGCFPGLCRRVEQQWVW